ncbi:MAG TPA: hypothetical protein VEB59_01775 [Gemmatimonadales bacterium]|nr:hypothetical protein [Gemmatimonadales bacterium]
MYGIIKQLPVLGLAAALAALAPRSVVAQETGYDSTAGAAPQDTGAMQDPSGYQGEQRSGDSGVTDTSSVGDTSAMGDTSAVGDTSGMGDSLGQQDTTAGERLRPTDTTGAAAAPSGSDSALAGQDSASVLPGDSSAIRPESARDRLNPTDSTGTSSPTQGP